jgi:hypothetical protein
MQMLYAAKCYWPGVEQSDVEAIARRVAGLRGQGPSEESVYRGSLLFREDHLVLCLFEGPSRTAVKRVSERVGIPCERVMDSVWLDPHPTEGGLG